MKDLEKNLLEEGIEGVVNLPSMEIARTFAVETIDYPHPLGLQYVPLPSEWSKLILRSQPMRFIGAQDHMIPLDDWCPEYKLATTERVPE
jgi:hypothetical protein